MAPGSLPLQTDTMNELPSIDADMTVNDVLAAIPGAIAPLTTLGIDTCCGGGRSLREVAERHGLDLEALLLAVRTAGAAQPGAGVVQPAIAAQPA